MDFTHIAELYGFKCYFNEITGDIQGTNWFNDSMIELFVWLDVSVFKINDCFEIKILEKL